MQYEQEFIDCLPRIKAVVRTKIGPSKYGDMWEEVFGDSIVTTLEYLRSGKFRGDCKLSTLAQGIARRRVTDFYRSYEAGKKLLRDYYHHPLQRHSEERDSLPRYLESLVAALPDKERKIILMRYVAGMNTVEIGEIMGLSSSRVVFICKKGVNRIGIKLFPELYKKPVSARSEKSDEKNEVLPLIDKETKDLLAWLLKMHNSYICIANMSRAEMSGVEQMIEDSTKARNDIAEALVCGKPIDKLINEMSDEKMISYLIAHRREQ